MRTGQSKTWNRFWNSSLQIQKRKFIPCVLEFASGTPYCQELGNKGSSSSRSLLGTAWVGDLVTLNSAKATPPTSPKMELGRYQLPFFPFKTKVLLSENFQGNQRDSIHLIWHYIQEIPGLKTFGYRSRWWGVHSESSAVLCVQEVCQLSRPVMQH